MCTSSADAKIERGGERIICMLRVEKCSGEETSTRSDIIIDRRYQDNERDSRNFLEIGTKCRNLKVNLDICDTK